MGSTILERTRSAELQHRADDPQGGTRRGKTIALLLLFVFVGFAIAVAVSTFAGSSPYGVLAAAAAIVVLVPVTVVMMKAFPQAMANARLLAGNWTWWHPLWFCIFFSMLVFRIRDVGAAGQNPLDAYAMLRILPEAF